MKILISRRGAVIYLFVTCIILSYILYYMYMSKIYNQQSQINNTE